MCAWFSESIFGGDTPLDELSRLMNDLCVVIPEEDDRGYGTPDEWTERAERIWVAKADGIPDWIRSRVEHDRRMTKEGTYVFLAVLGAASGARFPVAFARTVQPIVARHAKVSEEWLLEMRRTDTGRPEAMLELERWSSDALNRLAGYLQDVLENRPFDRLGGVLGLTALGFGTSLSIAHGLELVQEAGVSDLPHPWSKGAMQAYADRRERLAKAIPDAMTRALDAEPSWSEDAIVGVQVASSVLMATGAPMPEDVKALAVEAGLHDPWDEDEEREAVIAAYLEAVRAYKPGTPLIIGMVGLAEAVERKLKKGEGGLINRNIRRLRR